MLYKARLKGKIEKNVEENKEKKSMDTRYPILSKSTMFTLNNYAIII